MESLHLGISLLSTLRALHETERAPSSAPDIPRLKRTTCHACAKTSTLWPCRQVMLGCPMLPKTIFAHGGEQHTHTPTHIHTCTHTHIHTYTHTHIHTYAHTHIHTHTHMHTCTHTHMHTCTHTHTHTHTLLLLSRVVVQARRTALEPTDNDLLNPQPSRSKVTVLVCLCWLGELPVCLFFVPCLCEIACSACVTEHELRSF